MNTWIALFRGINIGGKNILKMAELRKDLESLKLKNVRTYIQSGNVVFESATKSPSTLSRKISKLVHENHGFRPAVLILTVDQLLEAVESNPFAAAVADPRLLVFFFLERPSTDPDWQSIDAVKRPAEQFTLTDGVFYLLAKDGFAQSKLAANVEKYLGVVATARNFRTVGKLVKMVEDI